MTRVKVLFSLFCAVALFYACASTRTVYVPVEKTVTVKERVIDTVVQVRVEKEEVQIVTADTTSTLSTTYATSTASIVNGGLFHHLRNRSDVDIPVRLLTVVRDTTIYKDVPIPIEVPVAAPIPKWQLILMMIGGAALGAALFAGVRKLCKLF